MKMLSAIFFLACVCSIVTGESRYQFTKTDDTLAIKVDRKTKSDTSTKADDWKEKLDWEIKATSEGIQVKNKYSFKANASKTKLEFSSHTKSIVEFQKRNSTSTDEKYTNQTVIKTWKLKKWANATYTGCDNSTAGICTAKFESEDGCFLLVAKANLATFQGDGRISFSSDDMKLDYVFGNVTGCEPSAGNALAVISKVKSTTKTKKGTKTDAQKATAAAGGEDGISCDPDEDGGVAYFKWLGVVDCKINNGSTTTNTTRKVKTSLEEENADDDLGNKEVIYTIHKQVGDGECVWDPVQGIATVDNSGPFSAAYATAAFSAAVLSIMSLAALALNTLA